MLGVRGAGVAVARRDHVQNALGVVRRRMAWSMKVAMMIPLIPPDFSGAGKRGWRMAVALRDRGFEVVVLTFSDAPPERDGIRIIVVRAWTAHRHATARGFARRLGSVIAALATVIEASVALRRERPEIAHQIGCDIAPQLLGSAALVLRVPVMAEVTLMGSDDPPTVRRSIAGAARFHLMRKYRRLVCISPRLMQAARSTSLDPERLTVIGNDVDTTRFCLVDTKGKAALRQALRLPEDGRVVISIGAVGRRKGQLELAHVFVQHVLRLLPQTILVVVGPLYRGDTLYSDELMELAASPGVEGRVRIVGEVDDAAPWLQAADVFAFASREEGFGTAMVEAMAVGLPIVARRIPGISEFILGSTPGTEIVESDEELGPAIVRALEVADDHETRRGISERARAHFAQDVIIDQYVDQYRMLTKARR